MPATQLPSFLLMALGREEPWWEEGASGLGSGREISLGRGIQLHTGVSWSCPGPVSKWQACPAASGERAVLKAKVICGGRTGRLIKSGKFCIKLSCATQSRTRVQGRPVPTLTRLTSAGGTTGKPSRQSLPGALRITPPPSHFLRGPGRTSFLLLRRAQTEAAAQRGIYSACLPRAHLSSGSSRPAMDSAAKDEMQPELSPGSSCPGPEWPEQERAEQLARGAALKWASGIFYRPEQLARLGQYRSREVQRTCSLEARLKSVVQSYLEGVQTGVWQLAQAIEAVQGTREALSQARGLLQGMSQALRTLQPLRERVAQYKQLQAMSHLLPRLRAVPAAVAHTQTLIDAQQFLEAYVSLRELEQLREDTWAPLGGLELPVFQGLDLLFEALGQAVEAAAGAAGKLAREDPALLVAAVRVAEVETGRTTPLGQVPRDWRQRCLRALQEGLEQTHFGSPLLPAPGALPGWLEALRVALPVELATAEALVAPCCPPQYNVVQLWAHTLHSGLRRSLQHLLAGPELEAADAFALLHWALHVYLGQEMMGSLELGPEADVSQLEPLLTLENIEQLEATFVANVQASVSQWLQNALDGEVAEWGREQGPNTDPSGSYYSPMPAIVLQILEENIRVASLVSESLQQRVHGMALSELGIFLKSWTGRLQGPWLRWKLRWTSYRGGSAAWCWRRCRWSSSPCSRTCPRASGCRALSCWKVCANGRGASAGTSGACGTPRFSCYWLRPSAPWCSSTCAR
ncbi:exocyst complex component 3-like protein isoform X7 [Chlorocebus sabaeus]|uniref:exocyst complex component 3-like protein isoform X7 n=1 Tax=Chlorocebus sabaeus TaxID=60711 RepID=UPI0018B02123|nr:exocyst complex component 3-like protein isoform X8 [Chlorocebus sabaeus]